MLSSPEQKAPSDIQALLRAKIQAAWELRRALDLPSQDTDVYRLVNRCVRLLGFLLQLDQGTTGGVTRGHR